MNKFQKLKGLGLMSNKIKKINKMEVQSILSSEVLPFETLVFFDNRNLFKLYNNNIDFLSLNFKEKFTIPLEYKVKQNGKYRNLSIVHPLTQLTFVELYKNYNEYILYHGSISDRSLRKPLSVTKVFYTTKMIQKIKKIDDENTEGFENTNFFKYGPMRLAHKIYDSEFLLNMEVKYKFMKKMDIAKCFYNIYTHSIAWATHDKTFAKKNTQNKKLFANLFDRKMQISNYNETNGIVVGPEFSRVFAEIILQRVDNNIVKSVEEKYGYKIEKNYDFYRYMDDFFVFSNDVNILEKIQDVVIHELAVYKLHLNISKEALIERPFCTSLTSLKNKISNYIKDFVKNNFKKDKLHRLISNIEEALNGDRFNFSKLKTAVKSSKNNKFLNDGFKFEIKNKDNLFLSFVTEIRTICGQYAIPIEDVCYYILKILDKNIFDILRSEKYSEQDKFYIFNLFIKLYFYFFKICPEYKNLICIASLILYSINLFSNDYRREVKRIFSTKINDLLSDFEGDIIISNSLIILSSWMGKKYEVDHNKIINILNNYDYFSIITGLNYCRKIQSRTGLKNTFFNNALSVIKKYEVPYESSECFLLCADIVNCPYIDKRDKDILLREFCRNSGTNASNGKDIDFKKLYVKLKGIEFFQWQSNKSADLKKIVLSKQLLNVY